MEASPCGGAVPGTPAPIFRIGDSPALLASLSLGAAGAGQRLAPCLSDHPIEVELSRLDKPPEYVAAA
jgi:hypothetical protein